MLQRSLRRSTPIPSTLRGRSSASKSREFVSFTLPSSLLPPKGEIAIVAIRRRGSHFPRGATRRVVPPRERSDLHAWDERSLPRRGVGAGRGDEEGERGKTLPAIVRSAYARRFIVRFYPRRMRETRRARNSPVSREFSLWHRQNPRDSIRDPVSVPSFPDLDRSWPVENRPRERCCSGRFMRAKAERSLTPFFT